VRIALLYDGKNDGFVGGMAYSKAFLVRQLQCQLHDYGQPRKDPCGPDGEDGGAVSLREL